tara:strand:+ start:4110 stop:5030 length:921 start_codon:yes stop_codon:yes gene_type:complete
LKKILVYRNCSLGDFLVSLSAIKILKAKYPESNIYFSTVKSKVDGIISPDNIKIEKGLIHKFIFFSYNIFSLINFYFKLRAEKFESIYYLNEINSYLKLKRDYVFFRLIGTKLFGFNIENYNYEKFNEEYYLCKRVDKNVSKEIILKLFKSNKKIKKSKIITISLGGRNKKKKWQKQKWKCLIKQIISQFPNLKIIIVGSKKEKKISDEISLLDKKRIFNLSGKTSIDKLFEIIKISSYHISHDDGTMHIASIFQKKGVAMFGITSEKGRWFPSNRNFTIFYPNTDINQINPFRVFNLIKYDLKKI